VAYRDRTLTGEFIWSSQHLDEEVSMATAFRSVGMPPKRREVRQRFWEAIALGYLDEEAAVLAGVGPETGKEWFRNGGGMRSVSPRPLSGRYLSFEEREEIAVLVAQGFGVRAIAGRLERSPSTISRELDRNTGRSFGRRTSYRASAAQAHADRRARRPKMAKLAARAELRRYVAERLEGRIARPDGEVVSKIVRSRHRRGLHVERRWTKAWSPEQIANRLVVDFPHDESMRISHEAIYQALYVQGRGALRRELTTCLRTGRALRVPRAHAQRSRNAFADSMVMISERPAEVADRAVPGHWEGDLIMGGANSAIGTLVERTTRFTMLVHLPAKGGHGAEAVRDAITATVVTLPEALRRSLTWDQGSEMAQHARLRVETGLDVYFCDPHSPWQRGTNENTNGLLRQYFPKGSDLSPHDSGDLAAVADALNGRPRKTLGWKTPAEALNEHLLSIQQGGVATTP
jgi:IS30 family transposase